MGSPSNLPDISFRFQHSHVLDLISYCQLYNSDNNTSKCISILVQLIFILICFQAQILLKCMQSISFAVNSAKTLDHQLLLSYFGFFAQAWDSHNVRFLVENDAEKPFFCWHLPNKIFFVAILWHIWNKDTIEVNDCLEADNVVLTHRNDHSQKQRSQISFWFYIWHSQKYCDIYHISIKCIDDMYHVK